MADVKRSEYTIEHKPHGTVVWYTDSDGYLCHRTFIFYTDREIHDEMRRLHP